MFDWMHESKRGEVEGMGQTDDIFPINDSLLESQRALWPFEFYLLRGIYIL